MSPAWTWKFSRKSRHADDEQLHKEPNAMKLFAAKRRVAFLGATLGLLLIAALPAIALAAPKQANETKCGTDIACVKKAGDDLIAKRQTSLDAMATKINGLVTKGHLTSTQANPLLDQINTNKSGLSALKTKLDGETDIAAARTDVKNIFLQFRIYAVFLPRTRHVVELDLMTNVDAKMKAAEPKIEDAIAKAPDDKKDQLNTLYADFKAQLKEAEAQIDAGQGQLPVLTPNTFNTDKATYDKAFDALKSDTKAAHDALEKARDDLRQIATILGAKSDKGTPAPKNTATPSA
jgi:uncharacterized protein YukE